MFKTQVGPRAAGEWFYCQVLNILRRHFMVYKSIDHRKLPSFCFYNNMEIVRAKLASFSIEKGRALHLTSFLLSVLFYAIATSQSERGNFDSYCKNCDGANFPNLTFVSSRFSSAKFSCKFFLRILPQSLSWTEYWISCLAAQSYDNINAVEQRRFTLLNANLFSRTTFNFTTHW